MSSGVAFSTLALVAALVCLMTCVRSSPMNVIEPVVPLVEMESEHACFFICNICFPEPEDTQNLLECSNEVCLTMMGGFCPMEKFLWLGHHCRHYSELERMWSSYAKH
ncbi:unnamed protein product [Candidula unifasciata]|uniref:Uncharacterized protein n=1 Tax=Candidula unifasciata TaxID=100452 RepID=A0A8S3YBU2_9EUPU|nr:unnamed protein product [Candidula unifasciata]